MYKLELRNPVATAERHQTQNFGRNCVQNMAQYKKRYLKFERNFYMTFAVYVKGSLVTAVA